jgi:transposase
MTVAYHYIGGMRDQQFLMPVDMADWLDKGHLAWFIIDVVDRIDTSSLHALHPNDGAGRPAYHPDMMLALLLYAYATSTRSSRRIEQLCATDAAYKVIAGGVIPDHATIARFLVNHEQAIHAVFVQVLSLCAQAGLLDLSFVAVDGTKLGTDAALDRNRTATWIRARVDELLAEARAADQNEQAAPAGLFDLDRLPGELSTRDSRLRRLTAALEHVEAAEAAAKEQAEQRQAKALAEAAEGRRLRGRKPKDPHAALVRAEADETAIRHRARTRAARRTHDPQAIEKTIDADPRVIEALAATAAARAAAEAAQPAALKANITDPDSRTMSTATGWVQGYNAQAVVTQDQIIVAGHVSQNGNDVGLYQPMIERTRTILDQIGLHDQIGLVLADAGYWSIANATAEGPDRLIATAKTHTLRQAAREHGTTSGDPPDDATETAKMEHRLRTEQGMADYTKRSHTVEPVFSFKANHGDTRFRRRGLDAAASEWSLLATVHNLGKLHRAS